MLGQIDIHNAGAVGDIPNDQTACIVGLLGNPFHIAQFACFEIHVRERDHGNLVEIGVLQIFQCNVLYFTARAT